MTSVPKHTDRVGWGLSTLQAAIAPPAAGCTRNRTRGRERSSVASNACCNAARIGGRQGDARATAGMEATRTAVRDQTRALRVELTCEWRWSRRGYALLWVDSPRATRRASDSWGPPGRLRVRDERSKGNAERDEADELGRVDEADKLDGATPGTERTGQTTRRYPASPQHTGRHCPECQYPQAHRPSVPRVSVPQAHRPSVPQVSVPQAHRPSEPLVFNDRARHKYESKRIETDTQTKPHGAGRTT
jgi:hypothetical protein